MGSLQDRTLRIRRGIFFLMALALLYFGLGGITIALGVFPIERYFAVGGIIGAVASVIGLFGLATMPLTKESLREQELETMRNLVQIADELKELEATRHATAAEVDSLESRKKEIEFLVRKASLSLFLQEREALYCEQIEGQLAENDELTNLLNELHSTRERLRALREEIETNPNVDILEEVLATVRQRKNFSDELALALGRPAVSLMRRVTGI